MRAEVLKGHLDARLRVALAERATRRSFAARATLT
jgi:hypothetical protein